MMFFGESESGKLLLTHGDQIGFRQTRFNKAKGEKSVPEFGFAFEMCLSVKRRLKQMYMVDAINLYSKDNFYKNTFV